MGDGGVLRAAAGAAVGAGLALAAIALAISFCVEFSQLAHPPWLDALRQQPGVALILGYDFVAADLVCYTAGVALAWAIDAVRRPGDGRRPGSTRTV